jgi:uncharacterized RDD family membrane protein YckC
VPTFTEEDTRVSGRRYAAHVIDGIIIVVVFVIALVLVAALPSGTVGDVILAVVLVGIPTVGQVAYFVLLQRRHGRTPGKALVGIRVVNAAGNTPGTGALVKRTLPLLIEYLYVFALVAMLASPYRQRFGDRWGGTYVIAD